MGHKSNVFVNVMMNAKSLSFLFNAILLFLICSCSTRKEKFSGEVVTKRGNPVANAVLQFGYTVGAKNAIQAYSSATTDANGHYQVNTTINRRAVIEECSCRSDSGSGSFRCSNYEGLSRIELP